MPDDKDDFSFFSLTEDKMFCQDACDLIANMSETNISITREQMGFFLMGIIHKLQFDQVWLDALKSGAIGYKDDAANTHNKDIQDGDVFGSLGWVTALTHMNESFDSDGKFISSE